MSLASRLTDLPRSSKSAAAETGCFSRSRAGICSMHSMLDLLHLCAAGGVSIYRSWCASRHGNGGAMDVLIAALLGWVFGADAFHLPRGAGLARRGALLGR